MRVWFSALGTLAMMSVMTGCDPDGNGPADPIQAPGATKAISAAPTVQTPPTGKPTPAKEGVYRVKKEAFKIDVTLKGVFEAEDMAEVVLRPEAWTGSMGGGLSVLRAVEQGAVVHKGDTLVWLDLEKIDQSIKDLDFDQKLSDLALHLAELEQPFLQKSLPLDMEQAVRLKKQADEDLHRFLKIDREQTIKGAEFGVTSASHYVEYAKEELKQLEKMYRAQDIREETEEIILKRQRHAVEMALYSLESATLHRDQTVKIDMPRREEALTEGAIRQSLNLDKARSTLTLSYNQKTLAVEKMRQDRVRGAERLAKLKKDREAMTVKSPADGVVYYGHCVRGQWNTPLPGKFQRGGTLSPEEVFMTVVKTHPLFIRTTVEEKDLENVRAGVAGKATPVSEPEGRYPAKVVHVAAIPLSAGSFDAKISVDLPKDGAAIVPGMACSVRLIPYHKTDALIVPATAVQTDDFIPGSFVQFIGKEGKPTRRPIKVGRSAGGKIEVLDGLQVGDEIQEKPS